MKGKLLIAVVLTAAILQLSPASANIDASLTWTPNATVNTPKTAKAPMWQTIAWDNHITSDHKEKELCGPMSCGKTACFDAKNKPWVCKTDTGKAADCYWHSSGLCLNKYKGKDLKAGDDVTGKFPPGE